MGKVPIRLREVVYTLSPFEQTVMNGVFKDVPEKLHRKFSEVRLVASLMLRSCWHLWLKIRMLVCSSAELGGRGSVFPCACGCHFCVSPEYILVVLTSASGVLSSLFAFQVCQQLPGEGKAASQALKLLTSFA